MKSYSEVNISNVLHSMKWRFSDKTEALFVFMLVVNQRGYFFS